MDLPMTSMVHFSLPGKRVCFWGAPSDPSPSDGPLVPWQIRLRETGGNTGNLFIGHGLFHHVTSMQKTYHPGFDVVPATEFDNMFDCLMIPASNFINPALDLEGMYQYFSRTKAPMYCFGLGSQVVPGEPVTLKPSTEAFIRLVSERSETIGVRGAFTADILWSMGIRNISLTGCPSLLGLSDTTLETLMSARPCLDKVATNYSNNVRGHSFNPEAHRETENGLFAYFCKTNSFYILQNEASELTIIEALMRGEISEVRKHFEILGRIFDLSKDEVGFRSYFETRLRVFYSVSPWISAMRTMTATVGTRFHGNIASILAGTPGLVLVHDMRTLELVELFGIPHIVLDRPYAPEEIIERLISIDYAPFARRINLLRGEWRAFAIRNGIEST